MMNTRAISLLLAISCLTMAFPASAQVVAPATTTPAADVAPVVTPPPAPQPLTALQAIQLAKQQLHALVALRDKTRPEPYKVKDNSTIDLTLAVWNRSDDAITIVTAKKRGGRLSSISPALPITVAYSAKLESQYALPPSSNSDVVGVIYPVVTDHAITRRKHTYTAVDTVYVPYSQDFYTPAMLSAGSDYLSFLIQDAYAELKAKGIKSRAFPDKLVVDVIDPYLVKSIAVIEHSDIHTLTGDESERAIGRFLVKLATNEETTFATSISSAGAAGLVQFIPSTYKLMVKKRTDLGLIPDFRAGMADHKNAVKAQVAYIDQDLADMPTVRSLYLTDKATAAEYLAASYNGGSTRVIRAYTTFGQGWSKSYATLLADNRAKPKTARLTTAKLKRSTLRNETVTYVAKLTRAYGMFAAGYFATPSAPSGALPAGAQIATTTQHTRPQTTSVASNAGSGEICFGDGSCASTQ